VAVVATALCALALAACGGDDDTTTDTTQGTPLTHDDFVAQADAICQTANAELDAVGQDLGNAPSQADLEKAVEDTVIPNLQDQLNQIEALGAPEGETEQVDEITTGLSDAIDELEQDPGKITDENVFADVNQKAEDFGLTVCGAN
jgi:hypothetical protein